jgi:hypothetical protein
MPTVDQIKSAIYTYGPVTAGVCAGSAWDDYSGGVFSTNETSQCDGGTNHQIILVGWDDNSGNGYWILRNSWGAGWGINGYMYITYNTSRVGEGTSWVTTGGCLVQDVYNVNTLAHYTSFYDAYTAAGSNHVLDLHAVSFGVGDMLLNNTNAVALKGGYDCNYNTNVGAVTTINGSLTFRGGKVTIDKIIIK